MTTKPAKPERFEHNGACVSWDPIIRKFVIEDSAGELHGYRRDLEGARELAQRLKGEPWVPPKPTPISVSPRAHDEVKRRAGVPVYEPPGLQVDEKPMPTRRGPEVVEKYSRAKAMTRGRKA